MTLPPRRMPMLTRSSYLRYPLAIVLGLSSPAPARRTPSRTTSPRPPGPFPRPRRRPVDYARDVAPILSRSCYRCHGPKKQQGGLALHLQDRAMAGGDSGPAIVPGKGAESRLIRYVAGLVEDYQMPPEDAGKPLSPEQIGVLRAWIDQGAKWTGSGSASAAKPAADHWSFRPPRRVTPPAVKDPGWVRNPIDAFVLGHLEREGMSPSPEADKAALIRRVSLDLTGLPPTIAEVDAFLADDRPDAYERLVDRLLASPALRRVLGPALARHGPVRRHQRLREGPRALDLALSRLGHPRHQRRHALRPVHDRADRRRPAPGRVDRPEGRHRVPPQHDDQRGGRHRHRGVPLRLGRRPRRHDGHRLAGPDRRLRQCHSHKYDPISQREYYGLFAFLNNADEPEIDLPDPAIAAQRAAIEREIARLEAGLKDSISLGGTGQPEGQGRGLGDVDQAGALDRADPVADVLEEARDADRPARRLGAGLGRQAEQRRLYGRADDRPEGDHGDPAGGPHRPQPARGRPRPGAACSRSATSC